MISYLILSFAILPSIIAARATQCGTTCLAKMGVSFEAEQHADNTYSFYQTPDNFSQSLEPGTLLRLEDATPLANYTVPGSLTMSRILYTTSNINGTVLPTSAYILWPYTPPPTEAGYSLVAWAHGTSGFFKPCSPSNYRSLQYHFMVPYALALQGIAVVAPDYAGLGVNTLPSGEAIPHAWGVAPAQANDLANAVIAARKAYPDLLKPQGPFVAVGHSQGGRTTWSFAERQSSRPLAGYKGTVAFAPLTRSIEQIQRAVANPSAIWAYSSLFLQPPTVAAVTAVFPAYDYSGMSAAAYKLWFNVLAKVGGCLPTFVLTVSGLSVDQLARPGWTEDPIVQRWANLSDVGYKKFAGPLLVLAGSEDEAVDTALTEKTFQGTAKLSQSEHWDQSIEFVEYEGMGHFPVIQASQENWLGWVKDRLEGKKVGQGGSAKSVVKAFRLNDTVQSTTPNFLVEWADPVKEAWKYEL